MTQKGFFASLFDISFSSLITTRIIKVLYVLALIAIGLTALAFIVSAFASSTAAGIVVLFIAAPLAALLYTIYTRVILEIIIVIFRIAEYNRELVELARAQVPAAAVAAAAPTTPLPSAAPPPSAPPTAAPPPPPASEPPPTEPAP